MPIFKSKKTKSVETDKKSEKKEVKKEEKKTSMKDLYGDDKKTKKTTTSSKKTSKEIRTKGNAYRVLLKPMITEKAADLSASNKYVFEVNPRSNKIDVAEAVLEVYGIRPVSVNVVNMKGKKVRHGRTEGRRKDWKKAIVTLPEGKTINIYEGV